MAVVRGPYPDVELPFTAITPYVLRHAAEKADQPAFIDGPTGRVVTFGQVAHGIAAAAGGLAEGGFGKGDVLAILSPNLPEYAIVFHAVARLGGIVTTINPTYTPGEVQHQLKDAGASLIVTVPAFLETARAAADLVGISEIIVFGEAEGATPLASLMSSSPVLDQVDIDPMSDLVVLPYSSGTTGLAKGVMLTHHNLAANLAQLDHVFSRFDDVVAIAVLPFFHIYGMQILMNEVLATGSTAITMPRFDLDEFLRLIQEHKVTHAFVVPPIVLALARHPLVEKYDLSSLELIVSAAAPLSAELAEEASARVGAEVWQGYGLTETSPVTHTTLPDENRPGSIGVPVPNTEVRIIDPESGEDLGPEGDGEVWLRGPQVMMGYLNNPEATADCIDDEGWFHSGDIGHYDADGHFYIVDRLKELIKYKGFQVPPAELEALLLTHPAIADAAVVPVDDVEAGQLPKAFVVLKTDQEASEDEIKSFVADQVATYKQIRLLEFIDAIPKSESGKILRRVLRDREVTAG